MRSCGPRAVAGRVDKMRWNYLISTTRWPISLGRLPQGVRAAASTTNNSVEPPLADGVAQPPLVHWVEQQGGKVPGATLANLAGRDGGSGWGLKASADAGPGSKLIELPSGCHLSYGEADDARLLRLIGLVPNELWGAKLALQLLHHRLQGPDSAFHEYITHLPRGVPGIPVFFQKAAQEAIDYPPVAEQVKKRCKWLFEFSQQQLAPLPGTDQDPFGGVKVDINALGWALAAVSSRAFRTRGPSYPAAMLPLIDMANHSFEPNCEVLPTPSGVGLYAKRQVVAGEPLLLSYGKLSNDFLFMDYGFIIPDNPYDTVQLRFDVGLLQAGCMVANVTNSAGAPLELTVAPWKQAALVRLGLAGPGANLELNIAPGPDGMDTRLLAAARALACKDASELEGRSAERLQDASKPLSKDNEAVALRVISGVCAVALSNFKTNLAQDKALLAGQPPEPGAPPPEPLTEDVQLSVRFRMGKKQILVGAIQGLAQQLQGLQSRGDVRERSVGAGQGVKGSKPPAATSKGFGKPKS